MKRKGLNEYTEEEGPPPATASGRKHKKNKKRRRKEYLDNGETSRCTQAEGERSSVCDVVPAVDLSEPSSEAYPYAVDEADHCESPLEA